MWYIRWFERQLPWTRLRQAGISCRDTLQRWRRAKVGPKATTKLCEINIRMFSYLRIGLITQDNIHRRFTSFLVAWSCLQDTARWYEPPEQGDHAPSWNGNNFLTTQMNHMYWRSEMKRLSALLGFSKARYWMCVSLFSSSSRGHPKQRAPGRSKPRTSKTLE